MTMHEDLVSSSLQLEKVKEKAFSDFNGAIKSLGAWGGDFIMVATEMPKAYVVEFFKTRGLEVIYDYSDLISDPVELESSDTIKMGFSNHLLH